MVKDHIDIARPAKILVVEDEPGLRLLVSDVLEHEGGFSVVEAKSGDDALAYLMNDPNVDCVFTDVRMPGNCDGIKLTKWLQSHQPRVRVIVTSANLTAEERIERVPYMAKPYDVFAVIAKINELLH